MKSLYYHVFIKINNLNIGRHIFTEDFQMFAEIKQKSTISMENCEKWKKKYIYIYIKNIYAGIMNIPWYAAACSLINNRSRSFV